MPHLSVVVAARNDDYGRNLTHRIQVFLDTLGSLSARYSLDAELVVVEWNPPREEARLRHVLEWPNLQGGVRILEVPNQLHEVLPHANQTPMFEYMAKNVGIRRARGSFVLVTNPDIVFSQALFNFFAHANLREDTFYRTDRFDVEASVPRGGVDAVVSHCRTYATRLHTFGGTIRLRRPPVGLGRVLLYSQLASHRLNLWRGRHDDLPQYSFHTNASGDFLLMARDAWHNLRGYPEISSVWFLDGTMVLMAAGTGLRQVLLPLSMSVYHQEHDRAVSADDLGASKRPILPYSEWLEHGRSLLQGTKSPIANGIDWGLADHKIQETFLESKDSD